jgi:hypothetical protein
MALSVNCQMSAFECVANKIESCRTDAGRVLLVKACKNAPELPKHCMISTILRGSDEAISLVTQFDTGNDGRFCKMEASVGIVGIRRTASTERCACRPVSRRWRFPHSQM